MIVSLKRSAGVLGLAALMAIAVGAGAAYAVLDHPAWALATAAGGAGLAAGGVVVLTF